MITPLSKSLIVLVITFLAFSSNSYAETALGVTIGDPTGISFRQSQSSNTSIEAAFAHNIGYHSGVHVHVTYLWDKARRFAVENSGPVDMYYGLGLRAILIDHGHHDGDLAFGPRMPLGLLYKINNPNLEFFAEISLALDLIPDTDADVDAGIGLRIRF